MKKLSYTKMFVPGISLVFCPRNYVRNNVYTSISGTQKNRVQVIVIAQLSGIYGSKPTESEGNSPRTRFVYVAINP